MHIDENNFILELRKHNKKALDFLYDNYKGLVYKVVLTVLKDRASEQDIEECVADVFIGIWKNILKYDSSITSFKKWLIAVSKYKSIDYLRRRTIVPDSVDLNNEVTDFSENIESIIIQKENIESITKLINNMNDIDRNIFIKKYFLDESTVDIANNLKLPRSNIDNRLSRGRKNLKRKWLQITGGGINE
ncbi:sigma-70 family RNA polymerase sigma factor [Clostridium sp. YIM B02505]|uniref:Sigma-70 family RNA polymerase sigma factor n=1 Tax=Clostridium yunnanense TaxID=2800325 RepID=A0ABS1EQN8_9CLOT|nr:sigma-70 family RNA polymerase sigma factor [Clostridium yunnanense]MBK1811689.1 sigma-70 family RNA polymerase sigma factor [Clostridium yunnanense]